MSAIPSRLHSLLGEPARVLSRLGLRTRMVLSFGLLFVVVLAGVQWAELAGIPFTEFRGEIREARMEAFRDLNLAADLKSERLLRWLEERRDDVRVIARSGLSGNLGQSVLLAVRGSQAGDSAAPGGAVAEMPEFVALVDLLGEFKLAHGVYDELRVVDASTGTIVASTALEELGTIADRDAARDAGEHPLDTRLWLTRDKRSGAAQLLVSMVVPASAAIPAGGTETVALIVAVVNLDDLITPILHTGGGLGRTGEALLVTQDRTIITSLKHLLADGTRAEPMEYRISARPAVLAADGHEGLIETLDYRDQRVLAAYRYIPLSAELGWGMVVKQDDAEIFAVLRQRQTFTVVAGLLSVAAVLVLAYLIASGISRPIRELRTAADRVAAGDMVSHTPVTGEPEVRALASAFNLMVERVRQRTAELQRSNRELEAFSYSVSHDLRAPLRAIDGFSLALAEDHAEELDADARDLLARVRAASQRMGELIDDMLTLARVSSTEMEVEPIDPSAIANEIVRQLRDRDGDREVEVVVAPRLPAVGDAGLVGVLLENLLDNAWKFTRTTPAARIEFDVVDVDGRPAFRVRDNGVGFDMRYVDKLFQPFQRLHSMEEFEGNGIGLATASRVVALHGGEIWAEGAVGEGASFFFTLGRNHDG